MVILEFVGPLIPVALVMNDKGDYHSVLSVGQHTSSQWFQAASNERFTVLVGNFDSHVATR